MTTQQLIEMAVLDALALLDDSERDDFERAFRSATPEVQAHVRREQTRLCRIESILPSVEPPAGLRAAVIAAVRDEIALECQHGAVPRTAGALHIFPASRVSPLWRAAAVGLATASVVFAGTVLWMKGQVSQMERDFAALQSIETLTDATGPEFFRALASPEYELVSFTPVDPGFAGAASIILNHETGVAYLCCDRLPIRDGRSYTLVLVDGDRFEELARFQSNGGIQPRSEPVTIEFREGVSLAITAANERTGRAEEVLTISEDQLRQL